MAKPAPRSVTIPLERIVEAFVGQIEKVAPTITIEPHHVTAEIGDDGLVVTAVPVREASHG